MDICFTINLISSLAWESWFIVSSWRIRISPLNNLAGHWADSREGKMGETSRKREFAIFGGAVAVSLFTALNSETANWPPFWEE
jgi:hypothetical protein